MTTEDPRTAELAAEVAAHTHPHPPAVPAGNIVARLDLELLDGRKVVFIVPAKLNADEALELTMHFANHLREILKHQPAESPIIRPSIVLP